MCKSGKSTLKRRVLDDAREDLARVLLLRQERHADEGDHAEDRRDERLEGVGLKDDETEHEERPQPEQRLRAEDTGVGDQEQDEERLLVEHHHGEEVERHVA